MQTITDIPYSDRHTDRRLIDIHLPDAPNGAAVLLIHGGGFRNGDKGQWAGVSAFLCERGYTCASAGYRLAPTWTYPAWIEDARLAMAFLRSRAGEYGVDPAKIATAGSSAGGYLALMLGAIDAEDPLGRTDALTDPDTRANAVVAYCPVTRMNRANDRFPKQPYPDLMPAPEADAPALYAAADVNLRITAAAPPVLLIHGTADETVPHARSVELARRITDAGGRAETLLLDGVEHGFGYGAETDAQIAALTRAAAFLDETFGV